jgi:hypothetical protein
MKLPNINLEIEIPFKQFLEMVDKLSPTEKILLKNHLEQYEGLTWQGRFGRALEYLGEQNKNVPLQQVEEDVQKAIKEVRAKSR